MKQKSGFMATVVTVVVCLAAAVGIVVFSNRLIDEIENEAKNMSEIYSEVTRALLKESAIEAQTTDDNQLTVGNRLVDVCFNVIQKNEFVPVAIIHYDLKTDEIKGIDQRNLIEGHANATVDLKHDKALAKVIKELTLHNDSIHIINKSEAPKYNMEEYSTLYYGNPTILRNVTYITIMEFLVIAVLITIIVMRIIRSRRERENIWKSLALETAHQIATPVSGLNGCVCLLRDGYPDKEYLANEIEKDAKRLSQVANRFQNLGKKAKIEDGPLMEELATVCEYINGRTPKGVVVSLVAPNGDVSVPHDKTLIGWSVENICKNAADAIGSNPTGSITVTLKGDNNGAIIEIRDTGKGMTQATASHIFDTGFTTKASGWGLGLALVHRIICQYHHGKVYVANSTPGIGTTFRIVLPRQLTVNS